MNPMAQDDLTDDTFDLQAPSEATPRPAPARSNGQASLLLLSGFATAAFGLALSVGPLLSWKAAQVMVSMDYLGLHGGALFVGGMVLMGLGMLRKGQHAIAVGADEAHGDTELVEEVATGVLQMRHALDHMQMVTSDMQDEVRSLQSYCEQLPTQILAQLPPPQPAPAPAAADGQGDAVFRLAASLDKVGARIEERMKSQFTTLRERLDEVETKLQQGQQAPVPSTSPEPAPAAPAKWQEPAPEPVVEPRESPLGVLDTIDPDEPAPAMPDKSLDDDFTGGLSLSETTKTQQQRPSAALPSQGDSNGPWGGELQLAPQPEDSARSAEERERMLAETRLRQSLQNLQRDSDPS